MPQFKTQLLGALFVVAMLVNGTANGQEFVQPEYSPYFVPAGQSFQNVTPTYSNPNVIYNSPYNYAPAFNYNSPNSYNASPNYVPSSNYIQPNYGPGITTVVPEYLAPSIPPGVDAVTPVPESPSLEKNIQSKTTLDPSEITLPLENQMALKQLSETGTLADLIQIEKKVQEILPRVFPAVVAIDGGSGVIVRPDGIILTASHVTKKANRFVNVRFPNGRIAVAKTLGTNTTTDTAALKLLDPGPWPFVPLESGNSKPGDWCIALGYPLSFKRGENAAVRIGRILKRTNSRITTDCTIMGGDSGGPLVNMNGNVIAISSRVKTRLDENFHIPAINYLQEWEQIAASKDIRSQSKKEKVVERAYLGILGETDIGRVRIRSVIDGSPAQLAGMMKKDVILELDGQPVSKFDDVLAMLETRKPGEKVLAKLNRFGTLLDVSINLGTRDEVK